MVILILQNGEVDENLSEGSRFSRWFRRDSPPVNNQSAQDANIKDSLFPDILKGSWKTF